MPEEFKPIRVTLSDEAFDRMEKIMKDAAFRSYSSTIEECIRVVYDIIVEIHTIGGKKEDPPRTVQAQELAGSWDRIIMRMYRLTGRRVGRETEQ